MIILQAIFFKWCQFKSNDAISFKPKYKLKKCLMNLDQSQKGMGGELGWASPKCTIKYKYHIHISHLIMNTQIWNSTIYDKK
jgi:hypothetical protein